MEDQADDKANKPWVVRDVPEHTRRLVKTYAAMQNMTLAQALEKLIEQALGPIDLQPPSFVIATARIQESVREAMERQAAKHKQLSRIEITFRYPDEEEQTVEVVPEKLDG